jgi:hypothetical protein
MSQKRQDFLDAVDAHVNDAAEDGRVPAPGSMDIPFHAAMECSKNPVTVRSHGKNIPEKRIKKRKARQPVSGPLGFPLLRNSTCVERHLVCDCWDGRVKELRE